MQDFFLHFSPLYPVVYFFARVHTWFLVHAAATRHAKRAIIVSALAFTLLNAGVFSMQNGRTTAFTTIGGKAYGLMPIDEAKKLLKISHSSEQLTISANGKTIIKNASQAGVAVDVDKTFAAISSTSGWRRLPVVGAIGNLLADTKPVYTVHESDLYKNIAPLVEDKVVPAKNANITIPSDSNTPVAITPEENGSEMTTVTAIAQLATAINAGQFSVKLTPEVVKPNWTTLDIRAFMPKIEAARQTNLTFQASGKELVIPSSALSPMIRLDTTGSKLRLTLDAGTLKDYLDKQASLFYVAPTAAKAVQKDGTEVSRVEGAAGKQLDSSATAALAVAAFEDGVTSIEATIATVTPQVLVTKTYSNTNDGLYKTIEDFAKSHAGSYRVAAVELSGSGNRSAFYNADSSVITASTYKLFISYGILQKVEAGSISMSTSTPLGSVSDCMYKMIHISDNDCASALQTILGWKEFDQKLQADGFKSTQLNNRTGTDKHSTARDEMTLVTRLYNHELLNQASTDYLFGLMENQIFRKGIPAGSNGSVVADKVGFLYALNHDIGIVYSPKSTYALVILTDGAGGWTNVRLLAQQIYDFYNQ